MPAFPSSTQTDLLPWSTTLITLLRNSHLSDALLHFKSHHYHHHLRPQLLATLLSACAKARAFCPARQLHALSLSLGLTSSVHLSTSLLDLYARSLDLVTARKVFDSMPERNVASWTAMINGFCRNGESKTAFGVFRDLMWGPERVWPNRAMLVSVLAVCGELGYVRRGREVHGCLFRSGICVEERMVVGALVDMYGRCKGLVARRICLVLFERVRDVERDVGMWSCMMKNLSRNGDNVGALGLFGRMRKEGFVSPNDVMMLAVIGACVGLSPSCCFALPMVHAFLVKFGFLWNFAVVNYMVDLYARTGYLECSVQIFREMAKRDVVSWSAMISAYGLHGRGQDALKVFKEMHVDGFKPDSVALLAALSACNHSGLVKDGKRIFSKIVRNHCGLLSAEHYACYVDLLGRSGQIEDACQVIRNMPMKPSVKMLTSLVSACRHHGILEQAILLTHQLIELEPRNGGNYSLLSTVHAENGNWAKAEEVRKMMKESRIKKECSGSWIGVCV